MSDKTKRDWVWWALPKPAPRTTVFADLIEDIPTNVAWQRDLVAAHGLGFGARVANEVVYLVAHFLLAMGVIGLGQFAALH